MQGQAALLERRRTMERANLDEEGEARRALEHMALERSRGVQVMGGRRGVGEEGT